MEEHTLEMEVASVLEAALKLRPVAPSEVGRAMTDWQQR